MQLVSLVENPSHNNSTPYHPRTTSLQTWSKKPLMWLSWLMTNRAQIENIAEHSACTRHIFLLNGQEQPRTRVHKIHKLFDKYVHNGKNDSALEDATNIAVSFKLQKSLVFITFRMFGEKVLHSVSLSLLQTHRANKRDPDPRLVLSLPSPTFYSHISPTHAISLTTMLKNQKTRVMRDWHYSL